MPTTCCRPTSPAPCYAGLAGSPVTDVHVFGRRGPAQVKFTPIELRELAEVPDVDVIVYEEDFEPDEHGEQGVAKNNQLKVMTRTLRGWLDEGADGRLAAVAPAFLARPCRAVRRWPGRGDALRTHRADRRRRRAHNGRDSRLPAAGRSTARWATGAARCRGCRSMTTRGVIPNDGGRVLDARERRFPGSTRPAGSSAARWA